MNAGRIIPRALALLALSLLVSTSSARAGWQVDGATVLATSSHLAPLVACSDGGSGTFVVWQEAPLSGSPGVLRAQHLLATGDVDPAWPATGAPVCDVSISRTQTGALPDHVGGLYVWWMENRSLFATRLGADGVVAPGWLARGRALGMMAAFQPRPSVIEDGAHGFYAAWVVDVGLGDDPWRVRAAHLGTDGLGAGGWPATGQREVVGSTSILTLETWPQLALAPDRGVFVAWALWSSDVATIPSGYQLLRLDPDGTLAAGWAPEGLPVRPFAFTSDDYVNMQVPASQVAISSDDRGGVFVYSNDPSAMFFQSIGQARLDRRLGDGSPDPGWPAGGPVTGWTFADASVDGSLRVMSDGHEGAVAASPILYTDSPLIQHYQSFGPTGVSSSSLTTDVISPGHETVTDGAGGMFVASFWPYGPFGPFSPYAMLQVRHVPDGSSALLLETHDNPVVTWYGDIALAPTRDGGAVFFWSQERERFGLFARRFTAAGEVTAAPVAAPALALSGLRYVPGEGVRARIALPEAGAARLELFDLAGRRQASARVDMPAAGERDLALAGTRELAAGLYFARLSTPRATRAGRVLVVH